MYPVTPEFLKAIRYTHNSTVRVEVRSAGRTVLILYPNNGSVNVDSRNLARRTMNLTLSDDSTRSTLVRVPIFNTYSDVATDYVDYDSVLDFASAYPVIKFISRFDVDLPPAEFVPETGFSPLSPFGNEIYIWRGIEYSDGSVEDVPLGVFIITNVEVTDNDQGVTISVNGVDRALKVARNRWTAPYVAETGNLVDILTDVLVDRFTDIEIDFPEVDLEINQVVFQTGSDPWAGAVSVAEKSGYDLFFDAEGVCKLQPFPDPSTATASTFYIENEEAMLLGINRRITTEYTYNGVILTAEGTRMLVPYRAEVWDDDVNSPTYRYGPFGEVPIFLTSTLLTSIEVAESTAQKLLGRYTGAAEEISWAQVVNPAHDVYDIVQIQNSGARVNVVLIIDSMTIPLSPTDSMSAKARAVRFLAANVGLN
jgi:hypothetical protein